MAAPLQGRTAFITGANRGLGLAIAEAYLEAGAAVFLCARDGARLDAEVGRLRERFGGERIEGGRGDVSDEADVSRLVEAAFARFSKIDILVNNAGVYGPMGLIEEVDWAAWKAAMDVNLYGSVLTLRALLPHFKHNRYGKIVQLSGGGATTPMPRVSAYAASKAAVVRLIETVAQEVEGQGIDANCIAPGALNTGMLDEVLAAGPEAVGERFFAQSMKQRDSGGAGLAKGAELAVFLASAASDGISGRLISALWDRYADWPAHRDELHSSDAYTLRRITGRDRNFDWGDR